jgi:deoxyribonuclease V
MLRIEPLAGKPSLIAAADASFLEDRVIAVAALFTYPELEFLDEASVVEKAPFPYVPGFLAFREGPAVIKAIGQLKHKPDLLILDGQGIAHPEGMGLASHVGVLLGTPSIGCAKSRLVGEYREPGLKKGSRSVLKYKAEAVGAALRTKDGTRVIFVSPGHRVTISDAVKIALSCARGYRVIEPIRYVDSKTKRMRRGLSEASPPQGLRP